MEFGEKRKSSATVTHPRHTHTHIVTPVLQYYL